ncbi:peptidoglycan-binding domain-containing protein [Streptomyces sp. NPDC002790]|uniref:peptidoglycan-binding domain-containing protein n=1 Tax=Streptomyces sp. NPDC002790 TaxID=3154431 RepID=UPI0033230BD1
MVGPDGAPSCGCEPEAFAPLRVRPYVSLSEPSQPTPPRAADPYAYPPPPAHTPDDDSDEGPDPDEPAKHGRMLLLSAVTGVLSVATLVTVLITSPGDEGASASDTTAARATAMTLAPSRPAAPTTRSASPSAKGSPSTSPSPTHSRTVTASPTPTRAKPDTQRKERRSPSPSTSRTTSTTPTGPTTLRRGDRGHEVAELQWRLKQLNLYVGEITGTFDNPTETSVGTYQYSRGITTDKHGQYGPSTRTALERETGGQRGRGHG